MAGNAERSMEEIRRLDKSGDVENDYEETHIPTEMRKNIEAVLNLFVRPKLEEDGGGVVPVYFDDDGVLWVEFEGRCSGCPEADDTAKGLIAGELMSRIPQIKSVELDTGLTDEMIEDAMKLMTRPYDEKKKEKENYINK